MTEEWELIKTVKAFGVGHPDSIVLTLPVEARRELGDKISERYAVYIRRNDGAVMYVPLPSIKKVRGK